MNVSVVIPAYNSESTIGEVIERTRAVLKNEGVTWEFIVVDDASRDGTWARLLEIAAASSDVTLLRFRKNFGQHNALLAGIRAAHGNWIVTLDDDLQHPPEEIPKLLHLASAGFDVIYGFPEKLPHSVMRNVLSMMTKVALQRAMGADTARHHSGFRLFRTNLRRAFATYDGADVSLDVLLTWGTRHFTWVPVSHRPRQVGKSNYTLSRLLMHAFTLITGFSTLPLHVASALGLFFTAFGGVLLAWVIGRYLVQGVVVPGFAFLASAISIFSGVQLFALGIIGEYLARVHIRITGRPSYLIAEVKESREKASRMHRLTISEGASDGTRDLT